MTADFAYDPVTAIDEAKAVGETAALFAEIRQIMRIPLVTSIWRGLAGMDDSLNLAWAAAKPIYESDEPERALMRSVAALGLPRPESLAPTAFACVGLTESDIVSARAVIAAYNRSNGLNLMATGRLDRAVRDGCDHSAGRRCGGIPAKLAAAAAARGDRSGYLGHDPACECLRFVRCQCGGRDALAPSGALAGASCSDPRCLCAAAITRTDRRGDSGSNHRPIWRSAAASFGDVRHTTRANVQMPAED